MLETKAGFRFAAVLAVDVVGYTRLMHADELGTHARFMALRRELLDPQVRIYGGRIVKSTGDGVLAEFPVVLNAVACAIQIQRLILQCNVSVEISKQFVLRLGLNVGEIIIEGNDIYGDGVNLAVRLEGISPPGGICMSDAVFQHVNGKVDFPISDFGDRSLKNLSESVRVFGLEADEISSIAEAPAPSGSAFLASSAADQNPAARTAHRLSIAVMPFSNLSGDPEEDYLADGVVEEIITMLSHFRNLFVIAQLDIHLQGPRG